MTDVLIPTAALTNYYKLGHNSSGDQKSTEPRGLGSTSKMLL